MDTHRGKQLTENQPYNKTTPWTSGGKMADGHGKTPKVKVHKAQSDSESEGENLFPPKTATATATTTATTTATAK